MRWMIGRIIVGELLLYVCVSLPLPFPFPKQSPQPDKTNQPPAYLPVDAHAPGGHVLVGLPPVFLVFVWCMDG